MNDEKEEPSLQEPSELECVLKQELGNISQVSLIKTVRFPANFTAVVPVKVLNEKGTFMLEPSDSLDTSLKIVESLIEVNEDGSSAVVVANTGKCTHQLQNSTGVLPRILYQPHGTLIATKANSTDFVPYYVFNDRKNPKDPHGEQCENH